MKILNTRLSSGHIPDEIVTIEITTLFFFKKTKKFLRTASGAWYHYPLLKKIVYQADFDIAYDEHRIREFYKPRESNV